MFGNNVDAILNDFYNKIEQLKKVQEKHTEKVIYLNGVIEELKEDKGFHAEEAKRAAAVATKLTNLVAGV